MKIKNALDDCACCSSNGSNIHRRFVKREFKQEDKILLSPDAGHILFILEGEVQVGDTKKTHVCAVNQMVLIGYHHEYQITALTKVTMLILNFTTHYHVCVNINTERVWRTMKSLTYKFNTLRMGTPMQDFVKSVLFYLDHQIYCDYLQESKAVEIFIVFRFFYTSDELAHFFYPVLYKDLSFDTLVRTNYLQAKTVQELAELCGYNLSTFKKLFAKHFGISPYQWMQQQKISGIKAKLMDKTVSIKNIAYEFGFVDQSRLNTFCKKYLNGTPLQIRKKSEEQD
ncbi:MAG: helix-turn-helix transcriptional regulator [Bacteroides intestinalis]|nr:helix-turn-helix transcriptional regulator [Bacteroides intestinalis]